MSAGRNEFPESRPAAIDSDPLVREGTVAKAAGKWLARRDRGLTAVEQDEFSAWLAKDPRHAVVLAELEGPFHALDRAAALRSTETLEPDADLLASYGGYPLRGTRSSSRRGGRIMAFSTMCAAAAAIVFGFMSSHRNALNAPEIPKQGQLIWNEPQQRTLPDGSVIALKRDTRIDVDFTAAERRIRLSKGEAHFTVAKNPDRPFIVVVGGVAVRAVGTAFNVRSEVSEVEVVVTEGSVRVDDAIEGNSLLAPADSPPGGRERGLHSSEQTVLREGHGVTIAIKSALPTPATIVALAPDQMERVLAWRGVWLEFVDVPLAEVANEFNRRNERKLRIGDEATGRLLVSGSFRADGEAAFVRLLAAGFGVSATAGSDGGTILQKNL